MTMCRKVCFTGVTTTEKGNPMYAGLSNYPPGVTGREYEIAGPDAEWTETKTAYCTNEECSEFDQEVEAELDVQSYRGSWWATYTCPACNSDHDMEGDMDEDYGPDPDAAWDSRFDD